MGFLAGRQSEAKDRQDEKIDRLQSLFETQASTMAQQSVVMNTILKKMEDEGDSDKQMTASVSRKRVAEDSLQNSDTIIDFSPKSHAENLSITQLSSFITYAEELPRTLDKLKEEKWNTNELRLLSFLAVQIWTKGYFDSIGRRMKVISSRKPIVGSKNNSVYSVQCQSCVEFKLEWKQQLDGVFSVVRHNKHSSQCKPMLNMEDTAETKTWGGTNYSVKDLVPLVVPVMQDCILSQSKMSPSVVKGLLVPYVANVNSLEKSFVTRIKSEALNLISGNVEKQGKECFVF